MSVEPIDIPVLTHEQQMLIVHSANREKKRSMGDKNNLHYLHIGFYNGKMSLSEIEKMKVTE